MSDDFMSIPSAFLMTQAGSMRSQMERSLGEARVTKSDSHTLSDLLSKFSPFPSPKLGSSLRPPSQTNLRDLERDIWEHQPRKVKTTDQESDPNVIWPFGRYGGVTTLSTLPKMFYLLFEENLKFS